MSPDAIDAFKILVEKDLAAGRRQLPSQVTRKRWGDGDFLKKHILAGLAIKMIDISRRDILNPTCPHAGNTIANGRADLDGELLSPGAICRQDDARKNQGFYRATHDLIHLIPLLVMNGGIPPQIEPPLHLESLAYGTN